jgi:hypothetical protein
MNNCTSGHDYNVMNGYLLDDHGLIPDRGRNFSLCHQVQTGSAAYSASYPMSTVGSLARKKVATA